MAVKDNQYIYGEKPNYTDLLSELEHEIGLKLEIDERRRRYQQRFETILVTYMVMGVMIAVASAVYFVFISYKISLTHIQSLLLLASGTGIFLSVASFMLLILRRKRIYKQNEVEDIYSSGRELLSLWRHFEYSARNLIQTRGVSMPEYSLRGTINTLRDLGFITDSDTMIVQQALEIRNMIVHGGVRFTSDVLNRASSDLRVVVAKLEGMNSELSGTLNRSA